MAQDIRKIKVGMSKKEKDKQANDVKIEVLKQVASGSPRGKFANIEELRRKYPNGNQYVYITENNGYWNYYDYETRQWSEGGSYLANIEGKQDELVSGINIKTINGNTILGGGNLEIAGGSGAGTEVNANTDIDTDIPLKDIKIGSGVYDLKKTYATKKDLNAPVEIPTYCDDRVEITGYTGCSKDLAIDVKNIPEQLIKIPTIKGRSERASENLLKIKRILTTENISGDVNDGIITLKGASSNNTAFLNIEPAIYNKNENKEVYTIAVWTNETFSDNSVRIRFEQFGASDLTLNENFVFRTWNGNIDSCIIRIGANTNVDGLELKIMLLKGTHTLETIPPFKPYNDNLVNSNNIFVSTGKQLYDEQWEIGTIVNETGANVTANDRLRTKNYTKILPNTRYYVSGTTSTAFIYFYDYDKKYLGVDKYIGVANTPFTTPKDAYYLKIRLASSYGTTYKNDIMLNYGSTPIPYEPYKDNRIVRCGELGQFDYIDNVMNKKHINTSKIITLDGSEDENIYTEGSPNKYFTYTIDQSEISGYLRPFETNFVKGEPAGKNTQIGIVIVNGRTLRIRPENWTNDMSVEQFKTWLKENPIKLVYKLDKETIEDIVPPLDDTMAVAIGGMQYQEEVVPNAPVYDITKVYYSSIQGQINANIQTDVEQQKEIDALIDTNKAQDTEIERLKTRFIYKHTIKGVDEDGNNYTAIVYSIDGNKITEQSWYNIAFGDFIKTIINVWWEVDKSVFNHYSGSVLFDNTSENIIGYTIGGSPYSSEYGYTTITEDIVE